MAGIKFECALCGQRIEVPPDMAGLAINCPMCGGNVSVPGVRVAIPMAALVDEGPRRAASPAPVPPSPQPVTAPPQPIAAVSVQPASPPSVISVPLPQAIRPRPAVAQKPDARPYRVADDWNRQGLILGGFVLLVIGALAAARPGALGAARLVYLLASILSVIALVRRQMLGAIVLLICTMTALIFSKPVGVPVPAATPSSPSWVETVRPTQPLPPAIRPPPATPDAIARTQTTPFPTATASSAAPVARPEKPHVPSDDPFRDALGPALPKKPADNTPTPPVPESPATATSPTRPASSTTDIVLETDRLCKVLIEKPEDAESLEKLRNEVKAVLDVDKKVRLMAAYSLGCMHIGKAREALVTQAYLKKQYPNHPTVKFLSPAAISDVCQKCSGKGMTDAVCPECKGQAKCPTCDGAGTTSLRGMDGKSMTAKCPSCSGSTKCRRCKGSGKISASCPDCRGVGSRQSLTRIKHNYLALLAGNTNLLEVAASAPTPPPTPEPAPAPVEPQKPAPEGDPNDGPPDF